MRVPRTTDDLLTRLRDVGFSFEPGESMRRRLGAGNPSDWSAFAASWNGMPLDQHLPEGHRYRRRRHATLSANAGERTATRAPHAPHYQAREYNPLAGGIERWFEPIPPAILEGPTFQRVLRFCLETFGALTPGADWHIECHQFRIEARSGADGLPTPEGVHRDGVDWVLVTLVARDNIASGTTTVHAPDGKPLGSFTLTAPLDSALVDDHRVMHGVTPVLPLDPAKPASRDVLVVTLRGK